MEQVSNHVGSVLKSKTEERLATHKFAVSFGEFLSQHVEKFGSEALKLNLPTGPSIRKCLKIMDKYMSDIKFQQYSLIKWTEEEIGKPAKHTMAVKYGPENPEEVPFMIEIIVSAHAS